MPGGTLPCLWVMPYAGRNPLEKGQGSPQPPGMGGVAMLVERFEATPPLRSPALDIAWMSCGLFWRLFDRKFIYARPLWAPVRLDTQVMVTNILRVWVRYKAPRPPPQRPQQRGRPGGVTAPDPPTAAPMVSALLEGACLRGKNLRLLITQTHRT